PCLFPRRQRSVQGAEDGAPGRDRRGRLADALFRYVAPVSEAEHRPHRGEGDQPFRRRGLEGFRGMNASGLPAHGRVECAACHGGAGYAFDNTRTRADNWRITNNPLAWGSQEPDVVVLGFSKGPTQSGDLARTPHDAIAYKGGRTNFAKIMHHVGLLE